MNIFLVSKYIKFKNVYKYLDAPTSLRLMTHKNDEILKIMWAVLEIAACLMIVRNIFIQYWDTIKSSVVWQFALASRMVEISK